MMDTALQVGILDGCVKTRLFRVGRDVVAW